MPKPKTVGAKKSKAVLKVSKGKVKGLGIPKSQLLVKCAPVPVFVVDEKITPGHAKLLKLAKQRGIKLTGLTRCTDKKQIRRNRRRSQAPIRRSQGPPPAGHDYDEFPYALTHQGGTGAVVLPNVSPDNQQAGRDLWQFYRVNNIQEGDSFDVEVP